MLGVNHTSSQDESSLGWNLMSPFPTNSITSAHVVNPEQHDVIPSYMPPYPTNYVSKSTHCQPCVPGANGAIINHHPDLEITLRIARRIVGF